MKKFFSILLITSLIIFGCATKPDVVQPLQVINKPLERGRLNIPDPQPLKLRPFEFITITPDNVKEVWKELKKKNLKPVIIGVTTDDYENLSKNIKDIEQFYLLQFEIIKQYKNYYEPQEIEENKSDTKETNTK